MTSMELDGTAYKICGYNEQNDDGTTTLRFSTDGGTLITAVVSQDGKTINAWYDGCYIVSLASSMTFHEV